MSSLKGKTLFISGASRGIGLAIALRAAHDGANVAIAAKSAEPHPKLKGTIFTAADEVRAAGGKALPVICDIRDEAQVIAAVAKTVAEFGGIDICVNNASAISLTNSQATDMKRFDLMSCSNKRTFSASNGRSRTGHSRRLGRVFARSGLPGALFERDGGSDAFPSKERR